jgi:DNA invertase Pin-like site-specific DNA recombinase
VLKQAYSYVRFSSLAQAKGDSLPRQVKLAEDYAAKHNMQLDRELTFRDLGISAFRGKNKAEGALAAFIRACQTGRVQRGSALLVESLDRLSREQVRPALRLLLELIDDHHIEVHTLSDERIYGPGTQEMDLVMSIMVMARAHEESLRKSQRVGSAWRKKKSFAAANPGIAITAKTPLWIHAEKGKPMRLIEERAAVVREIFAMSIDGHGGQLIAQHLNKIGEAFSGSAWHKSYVERILRNVATYGAFQPYRRLPDRRREEDGDLILQYFPAAIDYATFEKAQTALTSRYRQRKGRSDAKISNLFSGLLRDVDMGYSMTFYWRGRQLVTDSYRFKKSPNRISYDLFEDGFLHFLDALNWKALIGESETAELTTANARLSKLMAEKAAEQKRQDRLIRFLMGDDEPSTTVVTQLKECEKRVETLIKAIEVHTVDVDRLKAQQQIIGSPDQLRKSLKNSTDYVARAQLREEVRKRVSGINLYFRYSPLTIADIDLVNGCKRQLVFWPKSAGDAVVFTDITPEKLMTQVMEKAIIFKY